jgi:hypothetical protein
MSNIQRPTAWRHGNWKRLQLRYFQEDTKIRREKNIEDYIINNGVKKIHLIRDNTVLDNFLSSQRVELVTADQADLIVITDQRFSRLSVKNMIKQLNVLLEFCPRIYFCLNRYYLNANESFVDVSLPEEFDSAIVQWLTNNLNDTIVLNRSEIFVEDGSCFTWVIPSCELLLCKR